MSKINVILFDTTNKFKKEIRISKPKSYQLLLNHIKNRFKYKSFEVYTLEEKDEIIKIDNEEKYKSINNLLVIREIDTNELRQSTFKQNFNELTESRQSILGVKYNCAICLIMIENENPFFCYQCQNIFHEKCLKDFDKKCKLENKDFVCPICRDKLSIEEWKKKLDFEDNKNEYGDLLEQIKQNKFIVGIYNLLMKKKTKKIREINKKNKELNEHLKTFKEKIGNILLNIFKKVDFFNSLIKMSDNNILNNLINIFPLNYENKLDDISNVINDKFEKLKNYINIIIKKLKDNIIKNNSSKYNSPVKSILNSDKKCNSYNKSINMNSISKYSENKKLENFKNKNVENDINSINYYKDFNLKFSKFNGCGETFYSNLTEENNNNKKNTFTRSNSKEKLQRKIINYENIKEKEKKNNSMYNNQYIPNNMDNRQLGLESSSYNYQRRSSSRTFKNNHINIRKICPKNSLKYFPNNHTQYISPIKNNKIKLNQLLNNNSPKKNYNLNFSRNRYICKTINRNKEKKINYNDLGSKIICTKIIKIPDKDVSTHNNYLSNNND